jgi:hypothetical protein
MGDIAVFRAGGFWSRRSFLPPTTSRLATLLLSALLLTGLAACSPAYDWRDIRGPGGDYWVQLPARPSLLTRRIHLEGIEVEMTMQGAKVEENAFTVGLVPLPSTSAEAAGMSPERILAAMREQMLRNIGASPATPSSSVEVDLVDLDAKKIGTTRLQAVSAGGSGRHSAMRLHGRFGIWQGHAVQVVAIGPDLAPEHADHFLASLRLVQR